jgi:hypothetical protein
MTDDTEARLFIAAHLRAIAEILTGMQPETDAQQPAQAPAKTAKPAKRTAKPHAQPSLNFDERLAQKIAGGRDTVLKAKNPDDPLHEWAMKCVAIALKHMGEELPRGWP